MTGMKDIAYGYWWNCATCGTENAYGLTTEEADEYIKDWEEDNADLVAEGETGEGAVDWNYDVIARENNMHVEEKQACWKCNKTQKN
jgi:hypothetical protein